VEACRAELTKADHPIFGVPGTDDLSVPDLVDIYGLDGHFPAARGKAHEGLLLRGADLGADDDFVPVLEHVLHPNREIRKDGRELDK